MKDDQRMLKLLEKVNAACKERECDPTEIFDSYEEMREFEKWNEKRIEEINARQE